MDLSFIIVNYRNSDTLPDCLDSIYQTARGIDFEVIVIDNNSGDAGLEKVEERFPRARFIKNPANAGFAKANNQAAGLSRGDVLLFLNPDARLTDEAVTGMWAHLRSHPGIGVLGPKVLNPDGNLQYSCRRFPTLWTGLFNRYSLGSRLFPGNRFTSRYLMTDFDHEKTREVDWLSGCCMMIPRKIFREVGGFDEHYFLFNEDVDLCQTLKQQGYRVIYFPHARVFHHIGSSRGKTDTQIIIKRHRGMRYYYRKFGNGNLVFRGLVDSLIALRCLSQIFLNWFR
ncbi:MAG: glycosyltransferase family 2 protein [Nitrospinaceae bacterium]